MHVESVAWATERKDVLFSFFLLCSLNLYVYYKKFDRKILYVLCLASFVLSLLAKPQGIILVFVLLLLDLIYFGPIRRAVIIEKIPFFILLSVFMPLLLLLPSTEITTTQSLCFWEYLFNACYAIIFYLYKLVVPIHLSALYPLPSWVGNGHDKFIYILSPFFAILIAIGVSRLLRKSRFVVLGSFFFLLNVMPVLTAFPFGPAIVADRYTYMPSIGLFYILSEAMIWLYRRCDQSICNVKISSRALLAGIIAIVLVALIISTARRCTVWKNSVMLWSDATKKHFYNDTAYYHLGASFAHQGNIEEAIYFYRKAICINSRNESAYYNLGNALASLGKMDEAAFCYKNAININPQSIQAYNNLGNALAAQGKTDEAMTYFQKTLDINPQDVNAYINLGNALYAKGKVDEAIVYFNQALRFDPQNKLALKNLEIAQKSSLKK
jgi:Tfp pilus assembly protein PilF